jgi:hypothetical protein
VTTWEVEMTVELRRSKPDECRRVPDPNQGPTIGLAVYTVTVRLPPGRDTYFYAAQEAMKDGRGAWNAVFFDEESELHPDFSSRRVAAARIVPKSEEPSEGKGA